MVYPHPTYTLRLRLVKSFSRTFRAKDPARGVTFSDMVAACRAMCPLYISSEVNEGIGSVEGIRAVEDMPGMFEVDWNPS